MKPACRCDVGDKAATRLLMDLRGKDIQTDDAFLHNDHPVGDGHGFGLIGKYRSWKPRQASACSGYSTRIIIGISYDEIVAVFWQQLQSFTLHYSI